MALRCLKPNSMDNEEEILDGFQVIAQMEQARLSYAAKYKTGSPEWRISLRSAEHVIKVLKALTPL